jgi:hypothetical protein
VLDSALQFSKGLPTIEQSHSQFNINMSKNRKAEAGVVSKPSHYLNNHHHNQKNFNFEGEEEELLVEGGPQRFLRSGADEEDSLAGSFEHFGSQLMVLRGPHGQPEDFNKIHQNFAGDTFS